MRNNVTPLNSIITASPQGVAARRRSSGYGRWVAVGLLVVAPSVWAQQTPPPNPAHDAPSPADLEPGVNTSATPPSDVAAPTPVAPAARATQPKSSASEKPTTVTSKPDMPTPSQGTPAPAPAQTRVAKGAASRSGAQAGGKTGGKAEDHLQLDTTDITGNQELPKVLYIVPWKRSDLGDLIGKPPNSLIDEVLEPIDRDVFRRENRYYDALKPDASGAGKGTGAAEQAAGDKR
jgi:hypothetical protein